MNYNTHNQNPIQIQNPLKISKETPQSTSRIFLHKSSIKTDSTQENKPNNVNPPDLNQCQDENLNNNKPLKVSKERLNHLEFSKAIILDKRTFCQHYISILITYQPLISSFLAINTRKVQTIKHAVFFFTLIMLFGFNALFYNNSYISKSHQLKGQYDFGYYLPKSIIAYICTIIITLIAQLFAYYDSGIRDIERVTNSKNSIKLIKRFLTLYKIKIYIYFIVQFVVIFFFCIILLHFALYSETIKYFGLPAV